MKQVTAAVIVEEGQLFLARRPPGDPLAGLWELPGGKIEAGESAEECLARELVEELGMRSDVGMLIATAVYHYDHGSFELLAFRTTRLSDYKLRVHDAALWVRRSDIAKLPLAPADVNLVAEIIDAGSL